jgi:ketosteroid isomerase-like protein
VTREQVANWISAYERAWRTAGTAALAHLFTPDASYRQGPYDDPVSGLPAIGRMWEQERDGPAEAFTIASDIIAVDGSTAVVRVEVHYGEPASQEFRDLWVIRFSPEGLCSSFEEWPFRPAQQKYPAPRQGRGTSCRP